MTTHDPTPVRAGLEELLAALPMPDGRPYVIAMTHGTMEAGVYAPRGTDPQQPHEQDEIYIVMKGRGVFLRGEDRVPFGPGDLLFVRAGVVHRFEEFSDDLAVWVIFYGRQGGEGAAGPAAPAA